MNEEAMERIVSTPGTLGGVPRIAGRRIAVSHVATWYHQMGKSIDWIIEQFDLDIADVQAALDYYAKHKDEIDAHVRESEAMIEVLRSQHPSKLVQLCSP